jgi:hypothetical protein
MTVKRRCSVCGDEFVARRSDARFCSPQCRQKNFQNSVRRTGPVEGAGQRDAGGVSPPSDRGLVATVEAQLRALGQLHTYDGQAALGLAEHLCQSTISGAERASMTKALHEAMERVRRVADQDVEDFVDRLKARVQAKRAEAEAIADQVSRNGRHR